MAALVSAVLRHGAIVEVIFDNGDTLNRSAEWYERIIKTYGSLVGRPLSHLPAKEVN